MRHSDRPPDCPARPPSTRTVGMDARPHRLDELGVGIYVPLALVGGIVVVAVLQVDAPYVGAFVAFWVVGLCLLAALVAALVVLAVNARRAVAGAVYDRGVIASAAAIPVSLVLVVAVLFAGPSPRVTEAVLLVALVVALLVAPAGLFARVFGDRVRRRLWTDA